MTLQGIREAFEHLKGSDEMQNLQNAFKCRAEAYWLIGINGTRAITPKMFSIISRQVATVERVQTLTLAMIVKRDFEIDNLKPTKVCKISGKIGICNVPDDRTLQKVQKLDDKTPHDRVDRLWTNEEALAVFEAIRTEKIAVVFEQKSFPNKRLRDYMISPLFREKKIYVLACQRI
jgi:DNA topoisomerase-3